MNMRFIKITAACVLSAMLAFGLAACGSSNDNSGDEDVDYTTSAEQASLAKKAEEMNKEEDNFYGRWVATSERAEYLYGNLEITVNEDGTFTGNVTEEDFSGTWEKVDKGIEFKSELLSGKLYFGKTCRMVIYDEYETPVTLTKK